MGNEAKVEAVARHVEEREPRNAEEAEARKAWLKARLELHLPTIEKRGKAHNYAYAKLPDILTAVGPAMREAGFVVRFTTWSPHSAVLGIRCTITHIGGWSESAEMVVRPAELGMSRQNEMQVRGSAVTYACRYTLLCLLGTAPEVDDDASTEPMKQERQARETPYIRNKKLMAGEVEYDEDEDDGVPF